MSTGRLWLCARERDGGGWEKAACTSTVRMCTSSEAGHTSDGVSAPGEVLVAACATASDSAKFVQLAAQLAAMYLRHEAGGGGDLPSSHQGKPCEVLIIVDNCQ